MSTSSEDVQERDPTKESPIPVPRGGGDISGRGVQVPGADSSEESEQESDDSTPARE
jgi:hypothetical protein